MNTFTADACYHSEYLGKDNYKHFPEQPTSFRAFAQAVSVGHAKEITAKFPKFVNVKVHNNGSISFYVTLYATGVNDGKNEAGIKRIKRFLEIAGDVEWKVPALNSYKTLEDFTKILNA